MHTWLETTLHRIADRYRNSEGIVEILTALFLFLLILMLAGHRVVVQ